MKLPVCVKSSIQQTLAQARRHRHTHTHTFVAVSNDPQSGRCHACELQDDGSWWMCRLVSWHALLWGTIWSQRSETDPILLLVAFTHIQHILPQQWSQSWSVPERTQHLRLLILSRLSLTFAGLSKSWRGPATSLKETCLSNSFNLISVKWCLLQNWSAVPWQDRMGHEKGASAWERLRSHAPLCHVCYAALTAAWSTWWLLWWCWTFPPWEGELRWFCKLSHVLTMIFCSFHKWDETTGCAEGFSCQRLMEVIWSVLHGSHWKCRMQCRVIVVFLEWSPHFPFISPQITILDG